MTADIITVYGGGRRRIFLSLGVPRSSRQEEDSRSDDDQDSNAADNAASNGPSVVAMLWEWCRGIDCRR